VGSLHPQFYVSNEQMEIPEPLRCELCLKFQSSKAALKQHMRRIHTKGPLVPIQCKLCQKILRDEHTLKCHIKAVHAPKKFACDKCSKTFSSVGILNAHIKVHSDEKMFTCEICEQKYKDVSYFKRHQESHYGNKPHECQICGKKYLQASHLKDHMSAHTGERRFTCEICCKCFRHSKPFKEHLNMHQGNKPYSCSLCSYTSSFKKNLQVHQKRHALSPGESRKAKKPVLHSCEACSETFRTKNDLKAHTSSHHPLPARDEIIICQDENTDAFLDQEDPPIIILVNLASNQEIANHLEEEEEVVVEVEVVEEGRGDPMSPMSILLSAAESSEGDVDAGSEYLAEDLETETADYLTEDTATPLDLSIATTGTAHLSKNPENDFLEFTSVNSGRRRSVFLAEELDFEHQGDMTVVDPVKVTGVNG